MLGDVAAAFSSCSASALPQLLLEASDPVKVSMVMLPTEVQQGDSVLSISPEQLRALSLFTGLLAASVVIRSVPSTALTSVSSWLQAPPQLSDPAIWSSFMSHVLGSTADDSTLARLARSPQGPEELDALLPVASAASITFLIELLRDETDSESVAVLRRLRAMSPEELELLGNILLVDPYVTQAIRIQVAPVTSELQLDPLGTSSSDESGSSRSASGKRSRGRGTGPAGAAAATASKRRRASATPRVTVTTMPDEPEDEGDVGSSALSSSGADTQDLEERGGEDGRATGEATLQIHLCASSPSEVVYQRILRPPPAIVVTGGSELSQQQKACLFVEVTAEAAESHTELPQCLDGQLRMNVAPGSFAQFKKLRLLTTSTQQGSDFCLRFRLTMFDTDTDTFYPVPGAWVRSPAIRVYSHSQYLSSKAKAAAHEAPEVVDAATSAAAAEVVRRAASSARRASGSAASSAGGGPVNTDVNPIVTEVVPATGPPGTKVVILGAQFVKSPHLRVRFGPDVVTDVTFHEAGTLLAQAPPSLTPGTDTTVHVSNDGGTSWTVNSVAFSCRE
jgi:hypothetical protein